MNASTRTVQVSRVLLVFAILSSGCSGNGDDEDDRGTANGGHGAQAGGESLAGSGGTAGSTAGVGGRGPRECSIEAPTACPDPAPVYADVAPIIQARCVVCHSGMANGPWPLNTYAHVATWRDTVRAALLGCQMPPPDSGLDIPEDESRKILAWIRCGMPL